MKRLAGIFILACFVGSAHAASLTGDQLRAELVGKSVSLKSTDGKIAGNASYAPDGGASMSGSTIPGVSTDQGTWKIKGNKMCVTWKKLRKGKEGCFSAEKMSNGTLKTSNKLILTH